MWSFERGRHGHFHHLDSNFRNNLTSLHVWIEGSNSHGDWFTSSNNCAETFMELNLIWSTLCRIPVGLASVTVKHVYVEMDKRRTMLKLVIKQVVQAMCQGLKADITKGRAESIVVNLLMLTLLEITSTTADETVETLIGRN